MPAKFERCVKKVRKQSPDVNPYAVCKVSLGMTKAKKARRPKK